MRKKIAIFLTMVMLGTFIPLGNVFAASNYSYVRVKLSSMGSVSSASVKVTGQYSLLEYAGYTLQSGQTYSVVVSGSQVLLQGSSMPPTDKLTFVMNRDDPTSDWLTIQNPGRGTLNYKGNMEFTVENGSLVLVNRIYLDEYVMGVVAQEMSNSWPLEALKAQAIASRTYVAGKISTSGKYDVVDTTSNQAYIGYNVNWSNVGSAVTATAGMILKYNGSISDGVYSASNGGQISLPTWRGWSYNTYHQYKKDEYDLRNPSSPKVEILLPINEGDGYSMDSRMMTLLQSKAAAGLSDLGATVVGVSDVVLHDYAAVSPPRVDGDNAYLYARVTMNVKKSDLTIVSLPVDVSIDELKAAFAGTGVIASHQLMYKEQTADGKALKIVLRQYGHGIGMSQRGAQQMANEGKDVNFIISFYYPGNVIEALPISKESLKSQVPVYTTRTLKSGVTGEDVAQLQQRLTNLGYYSGGINGSFDAATLASVKAFQTGNGLTADGIVGSATLAKINSDSAVVAPRAPYISCSRTLKTGLSGADVSQLQQRLTNLGYYTGTVSGGFDAATKASVIAFQQRNSLTADGIVGPATLAKLNSDAAIAAQAAPTIPDTPSIPSTPIVLSNNRVLKAGVTGSDVGQLQQRLTQLGCYGGAINNAYDAATKAAVISFQQGNGLKADGIVGSATIAKMNALAGTTNPPPVTIPDQPITLTINRLLKSGVTGADVGQLQQRLQQLGCYSGTINNTFDAATKAGVVLFQNRNGLKADGIVGPATVTKMNGSAGSVVEPTVPSQNYITTTRTLRQGMSGTDVRQLQQRLMQMGCYFTKVDGVFGAATKSAVIILQRANGFTADGVVGPQTLTRLNQP